MKFENGFLVLKERIIRLNEIAVLKAGIDSHPSHGFDGGSPIVVLILKSGHTETIEFPQRESLDIAARMKIAEQNMTAIKEAMLRI